MTIGNKNRDRYLPDFMQVFGKKSAKVGKKIRVGTKIVGRVGLPEPHNLFVLALLCFLTLLRRS